MISSSVICFIVIICFASIQFIEVSSFFARYSGIYIGKKTLAYALQNAVFMLTRFFTMALLPLLGLLIDFGVDRTEYLYMVSGAFICSGILGLAVVYFRSYIVSGFISVLESVSLGKSLFTSLLKLPFFIIKNKKNINIAKPKFSYLIKSKIFWLSAIVFAVYALSIFMVFFVSLNFPDYRASISQLSGVTNALATVLLTFIIEPKISVAIDKDSNDEALNMLFSLILGRIAGVFIISQSFVGFLMVVS